MHKLRQKFAIPAIMIIGAPALTTIWYVLNTDHIGTALFGERLNYCNVTLCDVTRTRFMAVALPCLIIFIIGLLLLVAQTSRKTNDAKD